MDDFGVSESMSQFEKKAHSFVVRIWQENRDEPAKTAVWRGWIRHVQAEQQVYFQNTSEIGQIVDRYLQYDALADVVFDSIQEDESL